MQDVVGSDCAEDGDAFVKFENKTIFHCYGAFPAISRPLNAFYTKRGMFHVIHGQDQFLIEALPDFFREIPVFFPETVREAERL